MTQENNIRVIQGRLNAVQAKCKKDYESVPTEDRNDRIFLAMLESLLDREFKQMEAEGLIVGHQVGVEDTSIAVSVGLPALTTNITISPCFDDPQKED